MGISVMAGGGKGKAVQKVKDKVLEDRTFGLKNKNKSKVVQKYVQTVSANLKGDDEDRKRQKKLERERLEKEKKELGELYKPVVTAPKVQPEKALEAGVDPKTVLCQYFKAGFCTRGKNCKFSHDLSLDKGSKINLYNDPRALEESKDWDEEKLKTAVDQAEDQRRKAGKLPPTQIICKYFLEAVETGMYGWFWKCPNGGESCHYRHCLPPGFILKDRTKKGDQGDNEEDRMALEEELEKLRTKIENRTPVTPELFLQWKKKKMEKKAIEDKLRQEEAEERKKKKGSAKLMSGRDLFEFRPELFLDDDNAADNSEMVRHGDEYDANVDESLFAANDLDVLGLDASDENELLMMIGDQLEIGGDANGASGDQGASSSSAPAAAPAAVDAAPVSAEDSEIIAKFGNKFPTLTEEELTAMPKRDLIVMLKHFGGEEFSTRHQLGGLMKNVLKKKKLEDLVGAYKELSALRRAAE
eukprot:c6013_g2_i1.p1 GENE.c6013_g2_i1~~c6013_g2_i1.p1  ORF type:complete len:471 (-),score=125.67 c6013_g2_i1:1178-2590(-)